MHIPQLGPAPLAFDFGFPIIKEETDKKKTFSFSVQLPF
jgi:outer membrane protein insertion porin family